MKCQQLYLKRCISIKLVVSAEDSSEDKTQTFLLLLLKCYLFFFDCFQLLAFLSHQCAVWPQFKRPRWQLHCIPVDHASIVRWFGKNVELQEVSALLIPNLIYTVTILRNRIFILSSFQKLNCPCLRNIMSSQLEFFSSIRFHWCYLLTITILSNNKEPEYFKYGIS